MISSKKIVSPLIINDIINYILNSKWCVAILLFAFFEPSGGVQYFSELDSFYFIARILSSLIMGIIIIHEIIFRKKISTNFIIIVLFYLLLYVITAYKSIADANILIVGIIYRILKIGFVDLALKRDTLNAVSGLSIIFISLVSINFLMMLIFPEGLLFDSVDRRIHFLGIGNSITRYVIHGMNFISLRFILSEKAIHKQLILFFTIALMTFFLTTSDTGLIVVLLFLSTFILWHFSCGFEKRFFRFSNLLFLFLFFQISLVFFQATLLLRLFGDFNYILSGRTYIWAEGMRMFWEAPLFGYGRIDGGRLIPILGSSQLWGSNNPTEIWTAHNTGLQLMLEMGLFGILLISLLLKEVVRSLKKIEKTKEASLIAIGLFVILVSGLTESIDIFMLLLALIVAVNVGNSIKDSKKAA